MRLVTEPENYDLGMAIRLTQADGVAEPRTFIALQWPNIKAMPAVLLDVSPHLGVRVLFVHVV